MTSALTRSSPSAVAAFLSAARAAPALRPASGGRLIFALDATASREAAWEQAMTVQGALFDAAASRGGLEIQLVDYGGAAGFAVRPWVTDALSLRQAMLSVRCRNGRTQIERVLDHAEREAAARPVQALILIGDCLEEEPSALAAAAGRLALRGVPVFTFQEGEDPIARRGFGEIARITGGAALPFDAQAPERLRALLGGIAAFAAGGRAGLRAFLDGPAGRPAQTLLAPYLGKAG